ncbi:hypothetical protein JVT61DRAFT_2539 [Boletus reticuloceps]|uniref:Uncharacterized protein n=1 Tax=Boletus reticuloceps TaxID=495285 RepID=A0A8I2YQW6_9AGAM|nr:hypothetical protein JVT61DRAFT_2539 [Boletus reticuloceps]
MKVQTAEMERLRNEMKADMDARLYDLIKEHCENLARAIKQHEQELDKELQSAQEAMRVGDDGNQSSLTHIISGRKHQQKGSDAIVTCQAILPTVVIVALHCCVLFPIVNIVPHNIIMYGIAVLRLLQRT